MDPELLAHLFGPELAQDDELTGRVARALASFDWDEFERSELEDVVRAIVEKLRALGATADMA